MARNDDLIPGGSRNRELEDDKLTLSRPVIDIDVWPKKDVTALIFNNCISELSLASNQAEWVGQLTTLVRVLTAYNTCLIVE